jgi:hypothetical protein
MNRSFESTSAKFTQSRTSRSSRRERVSRRTRLEVEALEDRILLALDCAVGFRDRNEPFIAVNPLDPANVVVSDVNQLRISTNGGSSFPTHVASQAVPSFRRGGDDVIAFDSRGHLFWAYQMVHQTMGVDDLADIEIYVQQVDPHTGALVGDAVDVTTLDGRTHSDDKIWMAVDANPESIYHDNIYLHWTRFDNNPTEQFFSFSSSGGSHFTRPVAIATGAGEGFRHQANVAVGPNGDVYLTYHTFVNGPGDKGRVVLIRSTNGGFDLAAGTVNQRSEPFGDGQATVTSNRQPQAGALSYADFLMQGSAAAYVVADPDPARAGRIYVIGNDDPNNIYNNGDDGDVVMATSDDYGVTWTSVKTISHGPGTSLQVFPQAAIDRSGNLAVFWYDTRNGRTNAAGKNLLDVYATVSTDGGATFSPDFQINDASNPFDPDVGAPNFGNPPDNPPTRRIGEYNGIAVANGVAYVAFTGNTFRDSPSGPVATDQQIFFDTFALQGSSLPPPNIVGIEGVNKVPPLPAPPLGDTVAWFNGFLYRAGMEDGHPFVERSADDGDTWNSREVFTGESSLEFSLDSPALAADCNTGRLYIAWTGADKHLRVAIVTTSADGRPTGIVQPERLGYESDHAPALAFHKGALILAHAGTPDGNIFLDFMSAAKPHWGRDDRINFPGALDTGEISKRPQTLLEINNRLYLYWTGTDGADNLATVDLIGRTGAALQTLPVVNRTLTINGDQFGADFNDDVTIERGDSGGVKVTLNGQVAQFAPGAITEIVVSTGGGRNTVRVQATFAEVPVTINGGGTDRLTFLGTPAANPVYTPDANNFPGDGTVSLGGSPIHFTSLEFVDPVAPKIPAGGLQLGPAVIDENGTVTLSGQFLDPGFYASHTFAVKWGDGTSDPPARLVLGERSFTATHRYLDDNPTGTPGDPYTITATVTDNDNLSDTATTTVRVNNVAPQLANVAVTPEIDENGVVTLSGGILDPGTQDTFTLVVDWGEGAPESFSYAAGTTSFSVTHQYLDDNPTGTPQDSYAIGLTLTDDDTGRATATASTLVKNVAPVFTTLGTSSTSAGPAREGEPVTISGTFTDVGTLDTHTVTVDWGDGTVAPAALTEAGGSGSFTAQHAYQFGGIYPVLVTLRDDDTGAVSRLKAVFITGVGVHVVGGLTSLQVVGTIGPDQVTIQQVGHDRIRVHADFLPEGKRTLPRAGLDIIQVVVLAGNDHVSVAGSVDLPGVLDGGDGDDHLNGGNVGSVLIGGRGNDVLQAGNARDILIGGLGADRLVANGGGDILIGGLTLYDSGADDDKLANDLNLLKLWEEWSSERPYATRVANLRDGVGSVLDGTGLRLRKGTTVFDDLDSDVMTGSSSLDWFFSDPLMDKLTGKQSEEAMD